MCLLLFSFMAQWVLFSISLNLGSLYLTKDKDTNPGQWQRQRQRATHISDGTHYTFSWETIRKETMTARGITIFDSNDSNRKGKKILFHNEVRSYRGWMSECVCELKRMAPTDIWLLACSPGLGFFVRRMEATPPSKETTSAHTCDESHCTLQHIQSNKKKKKKLIKGKLLFARWSREG